MFPEVWKGNIRWMIIIDRALFDQRLEKRTVERDTRIPRPRRPIVMEDDQTGDEIYYSISSLVAPGESLSQTVRRPKNLQRVWRLSYSRWLILCSRQVLRWLTWSWGLISWPRAAYWINQPDNVHEAIRCHKVSRVRGQNGIPNRALKHLPQLAIFLLA
jgi:hypothetical protein